MSLSILQVITFAGFVSIAAFVIEILFSHGRHRAVRALHDRQGSVPLHRPHGLLRRRRTARHSPPRARSYKIVGHRSRAGQRPHVAPFSADDTARARTSLLENAPEVVLHERPGT